RWILPEKLRWRLSRFRQEANHIIAAFRWLRSVNKLIISGGGQLDDFWGGPWKHPWALFKWTLLARLRKARVLFLSCGSGTLAPGWIRRLVGLALALSEYRSYRDVSSRDLMWQAGFTKMDPVMPDHAYSYPAYLRRARLAGKVRSVAISPIVYCDPR